MADRILEESSMVRIGVPKSGGSTKYLPPLPSEPMSVSGTCQTPAMVPKKLAPFAAGGRSRTTGPSSFVLKKT